ncbi:4Fe-4S dicluster domain-containing protein [Paraburkholderia sp. D15]|uniref:4Fe-4S dicluster domain-containing protein n=1 Tax=Paraburkholderia sp. D15 TaxID=2880218 RepID=UPI00247AAB41|nr:4Fe-4S dicluster domain-containing protein [Paraburkholderia sp. D15]WGS54260.1 4Fe-4S dicluster domain-containing protein [Paraburkholderia sp. D15]WKF60195.1 Ferredoxin 1 [Paraburkholderia busanensis]
MSCVVTDRCIRCRYGDCVTACPVNAFHVGPEFLVIDPKRCINCTTCVVVCPIGAIVPDYELTDEQRPFAALNAKLAQLYPRANGPVEPLPDADQWAMESDKAALLR